MDQYVWSLTLRFAKYG